MEKEEINIGNKLIAEFMELKFDPNRTLPHWLRYDPFDNKDIPKWYEPKDMMYHKSWDWIMPVVEKIGGTIIPKEWLNAGWDLSIHYSIHSVGVSFEIGDHDRHISDSGIEAKMWDNISKEPITRTWLAVIVFIKWYNEQKK